MEEASHRVNVLLIEDDESCCLFIRDLLLGISPPKYRVEIASNCQGGFEALCAGYFDVCLLDCRLNDDGGMNLLLACKNNGFSLPVVMLSDNGDEALGREALNAGAVDCLEKEEIGAPLLDRAICYAIDRRRFEESLKSSSARLERMEGALSQASDKIKMVEEELYLQNRQLLEAQRLLQVERNRYLDLFEFAPDGYVVTDERGVISEVNRSACILLGTEKDALMGKSVLPFVLNPDAAPFEPEEFPFNRALQGERVNDVEVLVKRWDGEISIVVNCAPINDVFGHVSGTVASFTDITGRKKAEDAIRRSELLLQKVLDALPIGVWITDSEGCVVRSNPAVKEIWGGFKHVCIEDFNDYKARWVGADEPIRAKDLAISRAILRGETSINEEIEIECFDGSRKIILNSAVPIFNGHGDLYGAIAVNQDITSWKRAERQNRYLTRELIRGQENERQKLSYDLHDVIGQDLSALKIGFDTLARDIRKAAPEMKDRAQGLSRTLQQIIMAVRDLSYTLRPPTLDQLGLDRTIELYCREFSERNGLAIQFITAGMNDLKLDFDTGITLYRLVQESLNNVKKHAEASSVTIRLVASYPNLILTVQDNGRGFDVTDRLISSSKERCMGLRSMEERIALLEGKMKIESSPMVGAMIRFEVPYKERSNG